MEIFIYVLFYTLYVFVDVILFAMLVRAIFSWFPPETEGPFQRMLYLITEPAIMPIRKIFARMGWFQGLPIDLSFMATSMILCLISFALQVAFI